MRPSVSAPHTPKSPSIILNPRIFSFVVPFSLEPQQVHLCAVSVQHTVPHRMDLLGFLWNGSERHCLDQGTSRRKQKYANYIKLLLVYWKSD